MNGFEIDVRGPFTGDERSKIVDYVSRSQMNAAEDAARASERGEIAPICNVRNWDLNAWNERRVITVLEFGECEIGKLIGGNASKGSIGIQYLRKANVGVKTGIADEQLNRPWVDHPNSAVLVLVAQHLQVEQRIILNPVWASYERLPPLHRLREPIGPKAAELAMQIIPPGFMNKDREMPFGIGIAETEHEPVPQVVQSSPQVVENVAEYHSDIDNGKHLALDHPETHLSRNVIVLAHNGVWVVPVVPLDKKRLQWLNVETRPTQTLTDYV